MRLHCKEVTGIGLPGQARETHTQNLESGCAGGDRSEQGQRIEENEAKKLCQSTCLGDWADLIGERP